MTGSGVDEVPWKDSFPPRESLFGRVISIVAEDFRKHGGAVEEKLGDKPLTSSSSSAKKRKFDQSVSCDSTNPSKRQINLVGNGDQNEEANMALFIRSCASDPHSKNRWESYSMGYR